LPGLSPETSSTRPRPGRRQLEGRKDGAEEEASRRTRKKNRSPPAWGAILRGKFRSNGRAAKPKPRKGDSPRLPASSSIRPAMSSKKQTTSSRTRPRIEVPSRRQKKIQKPTLSVATELTNRRGAACLKIEGATKSFPPSKFGDRRRDGRVATGCCGFGNQFGVAATGNGGASCLGARGRGG